MSISNDILVLSEILNINPEDINNIRVRDLAGRYREVKDSMILAHERATEIGLRSDDDEKFLDDLESISTAYEELKSYIKSRDSMSKREDVINIAIFPKDIATDLRYEHIVRDFPIPKAYEGKGLKYTYLEGKIDLDLLLPPTLKNNDKIFFFQKDGDILLELNIKFKE